MGNVYASVADIIAIGRTLTAQQREAAETLLTRASALLRLEAYNVNRDIDSMIADPVRGEDYALAVNSVVVAAVCRALDAADATGGVESASETLGPYQYNYKYLNAGKQIYFMKSELKQLGLTRVSGGWLDVYGVCSRPPDPEGGELP
jgi:hypothetical protein